MDSSLGFLNHFGDSIDFNTSEDFSTAIDGYASLLSSHACENPIDIPGTLMTVRCNNRSAKRCKGCSELYRGDWRRIFFSGVFGEDKNVLPEFRFFFVTRTGPGFGGGGTHHVPWRWKNNRPGPTDLCIPCTETTGTRTWHHPERDWTLRGMPLDHSPAAYDYAGHIQFNRHHQRLFKADVKRIRDRWDSPELPTEQSIYRPAYAGTKENQQRLVVHTHTVFRFPVWKSPNDEDELKTALQGVESVDPDTGELLSWGDQLDVTEIKEDTRNALGSAGHAAVLGYTLKTTLNYTMKDAADLPEDEHWVPASPEEKARQQYTDRLRAATYDETCPRCELLGPDECDHPRHRTYGVGHRPFNKSQNWSLTGITRRQCKEERRQHVEQARKRYRTPDEKSLRPITKTMFAWSAAMKDNAELLRSYRGTPVEEYGTTLYRQRLRERAKQNQQAEPEQTT